MKQRLLIILIIIFYFLDLSCISNREKSILTEYLEVKSVVDGDTFWADNGSEKGVKIRLIGVDAPETRNTGRKAIGYYGQQSKDYLTRLLENKKVRLEYDVDKTDQYNRKLAYAFLTDGTFVNAELVKQGYAMVMTIPPNVKYADRFVKLERKARKNNKGLWNENHVEN
jgi:micrococcal nuclease